MAQHLYVSLKLLHISLDDYEAEVTTRLLDTCYRFTKIRLGLPDGIVGIPEMSYVTVEYSHEGAVCGQLVRDDTHKITGIHSSGKELGVTAFVVVNGVIAASAHQQFPR
jgi:hypothetical protein